MANKFKTNEYVIIIYTSYESDGFQKGDIGVIVKSNLQIGYYVKSLTNTQMGSLFFRGDELEKLNNKLARLLYG